VSAGCGGAPPLLGDIATIPAGGDGPVFIEPWEARVFALVVALHRRGAFAWPDFQALLIDEIGASERSGRNRPYYESWLAAAERLLEALGLAARAEIDATVACLRPDDRTVRLR
jgi:nitrile hydratase accessory protein